MPAATIGYIASVGLSFPQLGLALAIAVEIVRGAALVLRVPARSTLPTLTTSGLGRIPENVPKMVVTTGSCAMQVLSDLASGAPTRLHAFNPSPARPWI